MEKKEQNKKENKNPIKTYGFWFKIIAACLLIPFAIVIMANKEWAEFMVLMLTGLFVGIYAIIRFIPLMKTLKSGKAKLISAGEVVLDLGISAALIVGAINIVTKTEENNAEWYITFITQNYRFIIAFFLVTRVITYFWCTVLFNEKTDKAKFWTHILLIVLSCVMCSLANVEARIVSFIIAAIALICALALVGEGAVGYGRYRKSLEKPEEKKKEEEKEDEASDEDSKDAPTDQIIIPVVDEPTDSAIVN